MLVLHAYSDNRVPEQAETWFVLNQLRKEYNVIDCLCLGNYGYDDALKQYWATDDLVIIEQDIVPTNYQFSEIVNCKQSWCMSKYYIYSKDIDGNLIVGNCYAFGLTKISKEYQSGIDVSLWYRKGTWNNLDSRVVGLLEINYGQPHLHSESLVRHNHISHLVNG